MEVFMNSPKKIANFGVPWEKSYGYSQAVRIKDIIYVSGQLSHDKMGNLVAPARLDSAGRPIDFSNMEAQMQQTYANAVAVLAEFGASLDNVVEETLYVLDVDAAFAAAGRVRKEMYGTEMPQCASNLIGVSRLAFPEQLIEITFRSVLPCGSLCSV
ncbi:RidA family protein [Sinorhizobium fredii]|uniref:RidA family protein n=1 Tax=Rhizobium fredii TaxID=380 RepID=UPI0035160FCC